MKVQGIAMEVAHKFCWYSMNCCDHYTIYVQVQNMTFLASSRQVNARLRQLLPSLGLNIWMLQICTHS